MINSLTSLRFFFAFMVFLHHFRIDDAAFFPEGYMGVSFFFMLSGFILSFNYQVKLNENKTTFRQFYKARFARIYPLHFACFCLAFILGIKAFDFNQSIKAIINLSLLQSWVPLKSTYFSYNAPSWSISDEMFFYILFPIISILINKINLKSLSIVFGIILIAYFFIIKNLSAEYHHAIIYINPFSRIIDFFIGIILFNIYNQIIHNKSNIKNKFQKVIENKQLIASLFEFTSILLLILFVINSENVLQVYRYASYYWIPMSMLILTFALFNNWGGVFSRITENKLLIIAGEASFGFYMMHQLVITIYNAVKFKLNIKTEWQFDLITIFILVITASIISYYFYEKPLNKWIKTRV